VVNDVLAIDMVFQWPVRGWMGPKGCAPHLALSGTAVGTSQCLKRLHLIRECPKERPEVESAGHKGYRAPWFWHARGPGAE